jgi:hypothetical protein
MTIMTNWRIYGADTIATKLGKAELPGFFQKKVSIGPTEAALIVKEGRIIETVTQSKEVVLGFWERLKSIFLVETEVDVYIVDLSPVDIVIYLGKTDKGGGSADAKRVGPTETETTLRSKTDAGARAAGAEVVGPDKTETNIYNMDLAFQSQRDVSRLTLLALSSDGEVITAECRIRVSISIEDIRLLISSLRGRVALSTWDLTALIKDELLAKVLLPQIRRLSHTEFHGNRELLSKLESDTIPELQRSFSTWGLTLENFVINWGMTEPEILALDQRRQTREEEALNFTHKRTLADMQRNLDLDLTRVDNLRQLKIAEAKSDEELKSLYVLGEVDRAKIWDGKRLNVAQVDNQIAILQLGVRRQEEEIKFEYERRRKELEVELERQEMQTALNAFEVVQRNKRERQKQEQDFMAGQMNTQTGSIERMVSQGLDKGVVNGQNIKDIAKQYTVQRALDRSDAKTESIAQADALAANLNTFKEAEDRERKHQVDMTGQSAKMMDAAKQNVPDTLVQGGGATPHVFVPAGQPDGEPGAVLKCQKCNYSLQPGWKICPFCGEPVVSMPLKCSCGASLEAGWKICPFCGKPIG